MKEKPAKKCYEHIGGKLGNLLYDMFVEKRWIAKHHAADKHYYITPTGRKAFEKLGIDLSHIPDEDI
jgi:hypothetical protein